MNDREWLEQQAAEEWKHGNVKEAAKIEASIAALDDPLFQAHVSASLKKLQNNETQGYPRRSAGLAPNSAASVFFLMIVACLIFSAYMAAR